MRLRAVRRPGLTLIEVLVSLAIFLMSLVALGYLMSVASTMATEAHQRGQAAFLAQSKLAEVAAGAVPLQGTGEQPFEDDPDYSWSLTAESGPVQGLYNVTVKVTRQRRDGSTLEVVLNQMVLDPATVGSTQDTVAAPTSSGAADTSGATTTSTSSSPSTPASAPAAPAPAPAAPAASRPAPATSPAAPASRPATPPRR